LGEEALFMLFTKASPPNPVKNIRVPRFLSGLHARVTDVRHSVVVFVHI
jgi:hypothetical protein